jgi:hypothetical protein
MEQQQEDQQSMEMRQALETNMRRDEWIQHKKRENEPITRISINEQDAEATRNVHKRTMENMGQ